MRKILFLLLYLGILLSMTSCPEVEVNPFIGTWERTNEGHPLAHFVFTENIATGYVYELGYQNDVSWTGTYTYSETHITIILDQELSTESMLLSWPDGLIYEYKFENELLSFSPRSRPWFSFKKINY